MKGKTRLLSEILFHARALQAVKGLLRDRVVVLNYHRLRPDDATATTPFDDLVFGPTVSQFEEEMVWLKQNVHLLRETELIDGHQARRGPGELSVLVTTDDGYRDNYTLAYPVLRRLGIPALFFVPSAFIESRRLGWWDQLAYILKRCAKPQINFDGRVFDLPRSRREAFGFLNRQIIDAHKGTAQGVLDQLVAVCEVDPPSNEIQDAELMTWEQLQEMSQHDIAIGSHTHSHRILSGLGAAEQRDEMITSRQLIASKIGGPVRSVAYPVGGRAHFTAETQRLAQDTGYELGFSFYAGFNRWSTMNPFDIRRTAVAYNDRIGVAAAATLPEWFTWAT